jgi:ChpA-C
MKTWVRKTLSVGVLAAGALLLAPGAAHAGTHQDSSGNVGFGNGYQYVAPVNVPLNIVGNADSAFGFSSAAGSAVNRTEGGKGGGVSQDSSQNVGYFNGAQAYYPVNVPITVAGNAGSFFGISNAAASVSNGGSHGKRKKESAHVTEGGGVDQDSSQNVGFFNGAQSYAPVDIPINICGNSFSFLGEANAAASCWNGGRSADGGWSVNQDSSKNVGIGNGAQDYAPFTMPINLAGNSAAFLGHANSAAAVHNQGFAGQSGHKFTQDTAQNIGIGNGWQHASPVSIPINICGNSFSFLGETNAAASCGDVDADKGHKGHKGNKGHKPSDTAGDNGKDDYAGDNGDQDGQYMGDNGHKPADNTADDNGNAADNGDKYSSKDGGRMGQEAASVDSLTQSVGSYGGFDLLNSLR